MEDGFFASFWAYHQLNNSKTYAVVHSTIGRIQAFKIVGAITGGVVAGFFLPMFMKSNKMAAAFEKIDFMLPKTLKQRITFFFIAVTAGVCEEIIFRGAVTYFFMNLPFDLPLWGIGIAGAVLFGLAHWYQGISGIISTRYI